jgi:PAS domain S-box-containing protein
MTDDPHGPWYRETLDSLLEGFQIVDREWRYVYVNPAAATQGRRTPEDLVGKKMWEAYPGIDQTPLFEHMRRCMADRTPVSLENLFVFPGGAQRWFELRIEPVPEGICIHSFDIQSRKEAQGSLERLNAELEARVATRTRELEELNTELEAFSYSISHDLRAPLRHVAGFAQVLAEDADARLVDEDKKSLDRITAATRRMNAMIDALLDFSRLGRAPLAKQPIALGEVVAEARSDIAPEEAGREVVWSVSDLPRVHADPTLLRLAFVNLFSNALKYTRGRSPARIAVGAQPSDGAGALIVWVRDNGVGFKASAAGKLFGVFQRLHRQSEFEGTGIGLANVRRIVARHGGRAWAESEEGAGATFYLSLPSAPASCR